MPEFTPWETDDQVFPEIYAKGAALRERMAALQRQVQAGEIGRFEYVREYGLLRAEIRRAGIEWPYAYSAPVEWGGSCVECERCDGTHARDCAAVL